jgi:hypothetical protein
VTIRRNSRRCDNDPEALAARLPVELRRFRGFSDTDLRSHAAAVADWLNTQVPGAAEHLTAPVMAAAGLSAADWFKVRLGVKGMVRPQRPAVRALIGNRKVITRLDPKRSTGPHVRALHPHR